MQHTNHYRQEEGQLAAEKKKKSAVDKDVISFLIGHLAILRVASSCKRYSLPTSFDFDKCPAGHRGMFIGHNRNVNCAD